MTRIRIQNSPFVLHNYFVQFISWFIKYLGPTGPFEFFSPFKHGGRLNIPCNKMFDICEIKWMAVPFITLGYVNNYEKKHDL